MNLTKSYFILFSLMVLFGCTNNSGVFTGKGRYGLKFEREYELARTAPLLEVFGGQDIHIIDTLLLVQHQYENPLYYWDVYNLNDFRHLKSVLRRGRGPGEVLFAHYAGQYEKTPNGIMMFFFDLNSEKYYKINLTESILSGTDIVEQISRINRQQMPYFADSDTSFIFCRYDKAAARMSLMKCDGLMKNQVEIKSIYKNVAENEHYKLAQNVYYNPKIKKICIIPYYVNHIQIIDVDGNKDVTVSTAESDHWSQVRQEDISASSKVFYGTARITDDYIFALFRNRELSDMDSPDSESAEIHVFDWHGNAVARILLNGNIFSFAIDAKNGNLYVLDNAERLYSYDISDLFDTDSVGI